jgi:uncharacterized protein YktB (UPF0637 family)
MHVQLLKQEVQATAELAKDQLDTLKEEHATELKALADSYRGSPNRMTYDESPNSSVASAALEHMCERLAFFFRRPRPFSQTLIP